MGSYLRTGKAGDRLEVLTRVGHPIGFGRQPTRQELEHLKQVVARDPRLGEFFARQLKRSCCSVQDRPGLLGRLVKWPMLLWDKVRDKRRIDEAVKRHQSNPETQLIPALTLAWIRYPGKSSPQTTQPSNSSSPQIERGVMVQGTHQYHWARYQPNPGLLTAWRHKRKELLPVVNQAPFLEKQESIPPSTLTAQNSNVQRVLSRFTNLNLLNHQPDLVPDRYEQGIAPLHDEPFQRQVQRLVEQGIINNHTLVLSNTGHDIPIAAQLFQNSWLQMQAGFYMPFDPTIHIENASRLLSQARTWGKQIGDGQRSNAHYDKGALFLGLDLHRWDMIYGVESVQLDPLDLPDPGALKQRGINQVVCLLECYPQTPAENLQQAMGSDMQPYLARLKEAGLSIRYVGIESRRFA